VAVNTTTVQGTVYLPGGATPVTKGTVTASLSFRGQAADGATTAVIAGRITSPIDVAGFVTILLVPNDQITPAGTWYNVAFDVQTPTPMRWTEKWSVTNTPDPIAIGSVTRLDFPPGGTGGGGGSGSVTHTSGPLTSNLVILGAGGDDIKTLATTGAGKFLRDDSTWQTIAAGGDALVANGFGQFAPQTSLQLKNTLSDEVGTGAAVFKSYVDDLVTQVYYFCASVNVTAGTPVGFGVHDDLHQRGAPFLAGEIVLDDTATTPGLSMEIIFSGVGAITTAIFDVTYYIATDAAHTISLQAWNYNTSAWDTLGTAPGEAIQYSYTSYQFTLTTPANYVSAGAAKLRVHHPDLGIVGHELLVGYASLAYIPAGIVTDHGNLTGLANNDHPQYVRLFDNPIWQGVHNFEWPVTHHEALIIDFDTDIYAHAAPYLRFLRSSSGLHMDFVLSPEGSMTLNSSQTAAIDTAVLTVITTEAAVTGWSLFRTLDSAGLTQFSVHKFVDGWGLKIGNPSISIYPNNTTGHGDISYDMPSNDALAESIFKNRLRASNFAAGASVSGVNTGDDSLSTGGSTVPLVFCMMGA